MTLQVDDARRKRKEEGKMKKRQRIEESGGARPRASKSSKTEKEPSLLAPSKSTTNDESRERPVKSASAMKTQDDRNRQPSPNNRRPKNTTSSHRFGRVMESVPCRNKPRFSTVSIAVPGSVLSNCQTKELRTLMVGQIARAATIYHVDEIIVFDDKLGRKDHRRTDWRKNIDGRKDHSKDRDAATKSTDSKDDKTDKDEHEQPRQPRSSPEEFMARLLQYCECPQYLRRHFFPMHPDLQFAGLLAPVDAPHHVRAEDHCRYREGVVLEKKSKDGGSLVNCGIPSRPVEIDRKLTAGIRCTVKIEPSLYGKAGPIKGTVVSPSTPREDNGMYWGYTTRLATSINDVFDGCPFEGGYDLKIGTSERGDKSVEEKNFRLPKYEHSLIVFGGVAGIEECVDADESIKLPGSQSKKLFDMWLNTCPFQGSRTIRTEEAVLISLSQLSSPLAKSARTSTKSQEVAPMVEFSDEAPSDESSSSEESDSNVEDGGDDEE